MPGQTNAQQRVAESIQFSRRHAIIYGWVYHVTRGLIIVLSACAASSVSQKTVWIFHDIAPKLSLAVAILAGLEAWLKPGAIYKAHYRFNDMYIALESRLALIAPNDSPSFEKFFAELDRTDTQYREAIKG